MGENADASQRFIYASLGLLFFIKNRGLFSGGLFNSRHAFIGKLNGMYRCLLFYSNYADVGLHYLLKGIRLKILGLVAIEFERIFGGKT